MLNTKVKEIKKYSDDVVCAVDYAFRRIGGKYKGRLLWYLNSEKQIRYGELKRMLTNATPKMLTQTLRELEGDGLINRTVFHEVPPKVEYSLTKAGAELIPFINHLREWGDRQIQKEKITGTFNKK